jgi:7,8-dihydropterin-6-yl-methyl-4-(beta-D-ribofuranosyl)aminobenzene 5'-phosphate synthase
MVMKDNSLLEVNKVKITILMDNVTDVLMESNEIVKAYPMGDNPHQRGRPLLIAEHGFSALIEVKSGDKTGKILFDTGVSDKGVLHNADVLGIDLVEIQAIVLSHGHPDHTMGLQDILQRIGTKEIKLVLHPDALLNRKWMRPDGVSRKLNAPNIAEIADENVTILENTDPTLLADNMILVSGEITRGTEFEKGFSIHYTERNGIWENDPEIMDAQSIIINLRDQGLVIITGCGHAGIINTIYHAQNLTGIREIHAVLGGFHLTGDVFKHIIPPTISALKEIKPHHIMPGHCTGWSATHQIARELPEAFIPNNVGITLTFTENSK